MAKKILVIDDEPEMVTFLATLLEDNGYEILTASDGDEGLTKIKNEKPDLVSLDLLMPNKTGIKMFRELRRDPEISATPVVMVTGFATDDAPNMDFKKWIHERSIRPPEAYIEKPVDKDALLKEIKRILG
ncbi:MAG: response regulator [Desulfomonilaceae bacterium]